MNVSEILIALLLISASALCIALIYFLYQIVKSVHSISLNIAAFSFKLMPLIDSTLEVSGKLIHITDEIESQLQISKSLVSDIREHADKILKVETKIRNGIENAVMPLVKNINAVGLGVGSFWRNYKADKQKKYI